MSRAPSDPGSKSGLPEGLWLRWPNPDSGEMLSRKAVQEALHRCPKFAAEEELRLLLMTCSGGARIQVSTISLMPMTKPSAAVAKIDDVKGLLLSMLADPPTGGVSASFAMLGGFIIAEHKALIGF